jgi:hypothetical protein
MVKELQQLYRASPEAFFSALDKAFTEIDIQLRDCITRLDGLSDLADRFLTQDLALRSADPRPTSWTYHAALPNAYFTDVFASETCGSGFKRWVGKTGSLKLRLSLPRSLQYDFAIKIIDFASPEAEASFALSINDQVYPWLGQEDRLFQTIIQEHATDLVLEFEVAVAPDSIPADRDVSFSFATIEVRARV